MTVVELKAIIKSEASIKSCTFPCEVILRLAIETISLLNSLSASCSIISNHSPSYFNLILKLISGFKRARFIKDL